MERIAMQAPTIGIVRVVSSAATTCAPPKVGLEPLGASVRLGEVAHPLVHDTIGCSIHDRREAGVGRHAFTTSASLRPALSGWVERNWGSWRS